MKRLLAHTLLIFCLLLNAFPNALAFDLSSVLDEVSQMGSVQNAAMQQCIPEGHNQEQFLQNYQGICQVLRASPLCEQVPADEQLLCEDQSENQIDLTSFSFITNCARGLWTSLKDLFFFLVEGAKAVIGYTTDSEKRNEIHQAMGEYYDSFANYLALEFDKERDQVDSDLAAVRNVAMSLTKILFQKLTQLIEETYYGLGCYNQAARGERVCKIIGDVIMPPAAAIGLIFKGPKLAQRIIAPIRQSLERRAHLRSEQLTLAPKDAPVLTRPARKLSAAEMQSQNIKRLTERMSATMELKGGIGLAAPQVGQGLKLFVYKTPGAAARVMANPRIKPVGTQTSRMREGCLSLPGVRCQVERPREIEVTYLNLEGTEVTERFDGLAATIIQHETDHLNGIMISARSLELPQGLDNLSLRSTNSFNNWLQKLDSSEQARFKTLQSEFTADIEAIERQTSFVNSLKQTQGLTSDETFNELLNLYDISIKSGPSSEKFKKYRHWVKSEAHALYLYDHLARAGLDKNQDLIRYLTNYNEYFKRARPLRGPPHSLVTYSFEKESRKSDITLWFKQNGYTDEAWFDLSDEDRLALIQKATNVKKEKVSTDRIESTALKPHYIGNYSEELGHNAADKTYGWEIANKAYEIDLDRTLDEIKEVSQSFKETHSFHAHVVFDMPKNYPHFNKFSVWSKQANDYLYLKGMEEGLHGNYLTSMAHFAEDAPKRNRATINNSVPEKLRSVSATSHKFFSMGVRKDLYGKSPLAGHEKLGLELRDTTRNLDTLKEHMERFTDSVQSYRWESWPSELKRTEVDFLRPRQDLMAESLALDSSMDLKKVLLGKDVNFSIPLQRFEEGRYFDFKSGELKSPSPEVIERVQAAREYYLQEIRNIDANIKDIRAKGEKVEPIDIEMALKMTMTEWAKMARVSELMSGL